MENDHENISYQRSSDCLEAKYLTKSWHFTKRNVYLFADVFWDEWLSVVRYLLDSNNSNSGGGGGGEK